MARFLMTCELYAIRHVPTGRYMPQLKRNMYTLLEVEDFKTTPRLFWSRSGVVRAIRAWLKGPHSRSSSSQSPVTGEWDYDPGGVPLLTEPPANRIAADIEMVAFTLTEMAQP